jgi:hypothetical protein
MTRFVGGPFDKRESQDTKGLGETLDLPFRHEIDGRWYTVEHIYEVAEDGAAHYRFSQFVWPHP